MKTVLNVKVDKGVKVKAQKVAKELGIPLSLVVSQILKNFIHEKAMYISLTSNKKAD